MVCKWEKFWKFKVLPQVVAFSGIALQKKILTMDNLRKRQLVVVKSCPLFLNNEVTVDHLLLQCKVSLHP